MNIASIHHACALCIHSHFTRHIHTLVCTYNMYIKKWLSHDFIPPHLKYGELSIKLIQGWPLANVFLWPWFCSRRTEEVPIGHAHDQVHGRSRGLQTVLAYRHLGTGEIQQVTIDTECKDTYYCAHSTKHTLYLTIHSHIPLWPCAAATAARPGRPP